MERQTLICSLVIAVLVIATIGLAITLGIREAGRSDNSEKDRPMEAEEETVPSCEHSSDTIFLPDLSSNNPDVFEDLTSTEIDEVVTYMNTQSGLGITGDIDQRDRVFIDYMALAPPVKAEVLEYLDRKGDKPERHAHVAVVTIDSIKQVKMTTKVYSVGPLGSSSKGHTLIQSVPNLSQRLSELPDIRKHVLFPFMERNDHIFRESYNASHNCDGEPEDGCIKYKISTPWVEMQDPTKRKTWLYFMRATENEVVYPFGFQIRIDHDLEKNPEDWIVDRVYYNFQYYTSEAEFVTAYNSNNLTKIVQSRPTESHPDKWSAITRRSDSPDTTWKGPQFYRPGGRRYSVRRRQVEYMNWKFDLNINALQGMSLRNIRFNDERIVYELSLQDVGAQYSGHSPLFMITEILDSVFLIGTKLFEMVPGVDCPNHAEYMSTVLFDPAINSTKNKKTTPRNICIFEWNMAIPLKRHVYTLDSARFNGMENNVLVVRVLPVLYNYDYVQDFVFHQNGNIEIKVTLDGYCQTDIYDSKYATELANFAYQIHDKLHATVHNHLAHFKVDFDVLGTSNRYRVFEMQKRTDTLDNVEYVQDHFVVQEKETEKAAVWHKDFNRPRFHVFYNNDEKNQYGVHRGWELDVGTPGQNLRTNSTVAPGYSFSYQQMATTVRKETEESSSSVYNGPNPFEPVTVFSEFFEDDESIVDEDLVAWVTLGKYHIPKSEDLPIVTTPGNTAYFTLKPFNYFEEDPSMTSNEHIRFYQKTKQSDREFTDHKTDSSVCAADDLTDDVQEYTLDGY